jgi:hypothetical protein
LLFSAVSSEPLLRVATAMTEQGGHVCDLLPSDQAFLEGLAEGATEVVVVLEQPWIVFHCFATVRHPRLPIPTDQVPLHNSCARLFCIGLYGGRGTSLMNIGSQDHNLASLVAQNMCLCTMPFFARLETCCGAVDLGLVAHILCTNALVIILVFLLSKE